MQPYLKSNHSSSTAIPLLRRTNNSVSAPSSKKLVSPVISKPASEFSLKVLISPTHAQTPSILKHNFSESPLNSFAQITSPKQLPKKLSNLCQYETTQELEGLGTPATRKDVTDLKDWLNIMLIKAIDSSSNPESLFETANKIYKVCFHEIIRQVKVQCKERGELIKLVWDTYQSLFQQAIKITRTQQDCMKSEFSTEKLNIEKTHEQQISDLMRIIGDLKKKNSQLEKDLKAKEQAYEHKFNHELRVLQVLDIFKQQYSMLKEELLLVKEENRIWKIKYENLENITNKAASKYKKKSAFFIKNIVKSDPLMAYTTDQIGTDVTKKLIDHSKIYLVKQEEDLFTRVDFVDQESNTRILTLVSIGVNTNVEDLCGETVGTKMRRRRKSKISITSSLSIAPQANNIVEVSENLLDKNEFLESQMKKKHVFVKKLLQGMSQVTDH